MTRDANRPFLSVLQFSSWIWFRNKLEIRRRTRCETIDRQYPHSSALPSPHASIDQHQIESANFRDVRGMVFVAEHCKLNDPGASDLF